jgi:gas vesicle protein
LTQKRQTNVWSFLSAFAIGSLLGAAIALLFTPQTGPETRKMLLSKGQDLKDKAVQTTNKTGKAVGDLALQARDRASTLLHRSQQNVENHKSNIEEEAKSKSVQFR